MASAMVKMISESQKNGVAASKYQAAIESVSGGLAGWRIGSCGEISSVSALVR